METSITKDLALLAVGIVAGLLPWLFDKAGLEMPRWLIVSVGVCAIIAVAWALSSLASIAAPERFNRPRLSVVNVGLLCIALLSGLLWLAASLGLRNNFRDGPPDELIYNQSFRNQEVVLDGRMYRKCVFENVTFVFKGERSFGIQESTFKGKRILTSPNKAVETAVYALKGLGMLKDMPIYSQGAPPLVDPPKQAP